MYQMEWNAKSLDGLKEGGVSDESFGAEEGLGGRGCYRCLIGFSSKIGSSISPRLKLGR